jgi:hypothetical protein
MSRVISLEVQERILQHTEKSLHCCPFSVASLVLTRQPTVVSDERSGGGNSVELQGIQK